MTNEIKEILDELESLFEISEAPEHIINGFNKIKDYITNLQEEKEYYRRLSECYKADVQAVEDISAENLSELQSKFDKAIEYIPTFRKTIQSHEPGLTCLKVLEDILKEDK